MSGFRTYRNENFPPVVQGLIFVNILVYILQLTLDKSLHFTERISLYPIMPAELYHVLERTGVYRSYEHFYPYQIVTHLFAHSPDTFWHIALNMLALWMFGRIMENYWGSKRFLSFHLICGLGAAACHLLIQYFRCEQLLHDLATNPRLLQALMDQDPAIESYMAPVGAALGASGAIMGIFAAFGYLFPNTPLYILFIPIPIKAKWVVLGYVAYDLFGGLRSGAGDNVAHFAHLGGALTGIVLVLIWNRFNRKRFY
jgi:membrane associated rhomboid family serine protease